MEKEVRTREKQKGRNTCNAKHSPVGSNALMVAVCLCVCHNGCVTLIPYCKIHPVRINCARNVPPLVLCDLSYFIH